MPNVKYEKPLREVHFLNRQFSSLYARLRSLPAECTHHRLRSRKKAMTIQSQNASHGKSSVPVARTGKENKIRMPETVRNIIDSLAKPYGVDFIALIKNKMQTTKKYLSIHEAERYSSLSRWTLGRAIKAGDLEAAKLSNAKSGKVLIKKEDLGSYIEAHNIKHSG